MTEIKKVLITAEFTDANKQKVIDAFSPAQIVFCHYMDKENIKKEAADADVCVLFGDLDDNILASKTVKWVHCCHAGLERSAKKEVFERGLIVTGSSGRSAPALAEHAMMFMTALTYDLPNLYREGQLKHKWGVSREYFFNYMKTKTSIRYKTVGIIGAGKTGCELAKLCKAYDMTVLGWRRSDVLPENFDEIYSSDKGDNLDSLLERCDYVALTLELNDETYHLISADRFKAMKKHPILINLARGGLIDEEAMVEALKNGQISAAGLDAFTTEPLPDDSELWDMPNVLITPHMTPSIPDKEKRVVDYLLHNLAVFKADGTDYVNRLTKRDILTKGKPARSFVV